MNETEQCPQCGQTRAEGYVVVHVPVRFLIFTKLVRLLYSPRCGFLKASML